VGRKKEEGEKGTVSALLIFEKPQPSPVAFL
jgi:hypothetical protein